MRQERLAYCLKVNWNKKKASIFTDEQGLQTLYIPDIYERVYPTVITSLEILGVNIINQDQSSGTIEITLKIK